MLVELSEKSLTIAIAETISLWADDRYQDYLIGHGRQKLDEDWFEWFIGEWRVARTVRQGRKPEVCSYFNKYLPRMLKGRGADKGAAVDCAAVYLRDSKLATRNGNSGGYRRPTSLVSKVAFLYSPGWYPPMDKYSKKGLNALRGTKRKGGVGHLGFASYAEYLSCFEIHYRAHQKSIVEALAERWVTTYWRKLGVNESVRCTEKFRRKVFDNVLMQIGRSSAT